MIVGVGTDLVHVPRVEAIFKQFSKRFADRILAPTERVEFDNRPSALFLAKRFAVKEAAAKALGTGIAQGVSFQDFWVSHTPHGKPILNVSHQIAQKFAKNGTLQAHLSITDEAAYVLAFVVIELVQG